MSFLTQVERVLNFVRYSNDPPTFFEMLYQAFVATGFLENMITRKLNQNRLDSWVRIARR